MGLKNEACLGYNNLGGVAYLQQDMIAHFGCPKDIPYCTTACP